MFTGIRCFTRAGALELFTQAQLQLAGGLFAESYRDDLTNRGALISDQRDDAAHQLGGLAGARSGFDDQRLVELGGNQLAVLLPARCGPHGIFLSSSRSANSAASLARVRACSRRPHTTR